MSKVALRVAVSVVVAAAVLVLAGLVGRPAEAAPGESTTPIRNPDLAKSCGIDIEIILDESGSVADFKRNVQDAFRAFTSAINNTGSRIAVSEFSTVARLPLPGAANKAYTTVTDATQRDIFEPYISTNYTPNGSTDWEDAFRVGRYFLPRPSPNKPHLVVFITDGDPNEIIREDQVTYSPGNTNTSLNEYERKVPLADSEVTSAGSAAAKDRAVPNANALKAQGSHILTVAVGNGLSSPQSLARIIDVSGPDVFSGTGTFNIATNDVYRVPNFADLEAAMRQAAFQLCAPSITVRKLLDLTPDPSTPNDRVPGVDWEMTATATPTPAAWVLPPTGAGNTATTTTDASGFAQFQWTTTVPGNSTFQITEEDPGGVPPGFVNDPSATQCTFRTPEHGDQSLPVNATNGGFTATVSDRAIATCQMVNRALPDPQIQIEKSTNGADADNPPGPFIPVTDPDGNPTPITWTYVVTNTGNDTLSAIDVTDDQPGVSVSCPSGSLAPGASKTCTATGTAERGAYENLGSVTATDPFGTDVSDDDPSHYFGAASGIDIEKATNGADADNAPGPVVRIGDPVTWTYMVTNTGDTPLTDVAVTDDQGVTVTCPQTTLAPGASMPCTAPTASAEVGQYENVGSVRATSPTRIVRDSDPSHYFGEEASIDIEKSTNDEDADAEPGPFVAVGDRVTWTYVVTNTGNVPLSWAVDDDQIGTPACPRIGLISPGQSLTCRAGRNAQPGQYENIGSVTGTSPSGTEVTDEDPSHYFGVQGAIDLEKLVNDEDADDPPGPFVPVGGAITWTYRVTNVGNSQLTGVVVDDLDPGVQVTCPPSTSILDVGESSDCTATDTATAGPHTDLASATGQTEAGGSVSDQDPANYFGAQPGIHIEKSTNGVDADAAPGPFIPVGSRVDWTYVVTNTGNNTLSDVEVTDDQGVSVSCPDDVLDPQEEMTCTATGTAERGLYENTGTATGSDGATSVTDTDPSHYFGADAQVDIEKATNGQDADDPPGPSIPVGADVTWTYVVTNPGNVPLADVVVNDDVAGVDPAFQDGDDDSDGLLDPSETWTYEATGSAEPGLYENTGTVTAFDRLENRVRDDDPSHYFGAQPELEIEKSTNGLDADVGPGPQIAVGDDVTWTYVVTNPGNVPIADVAVDDDQAGVSPAFVSGDDDSDGLLDPGETWTFEATGTATAGQYENTGTATGTDPQGLGLSADDPSHYFGVGSAIEIEKSTNGADADNPTGPLITVGDPVTWTYVVTNPGNAPIADVEVTDDQAGVDPAFTGGDDDSDGELDPSETWTFEATGTATEGQYENFGTVTGTDVLGAGLTDTDPSHYFGAASAIDIEKATNGADADDPPGPFIPVTDPSGDPTLITWTYVVTNTGNARLTGLEVTDDHAGVTVSCPVDSLAPGRSTTCTATADAERGRYANLGTATATDELGTEVSDEDPSHYVGVVPGIDVEKATNGADADNAPGPFVPVGDPVTWTYVVTNTGDDPLTEVVVTDDQGVAVSCPQTTLAPDASMPCTAPAGTAEPGQYENLATATATGTGGRTVRDSDPSHYFGSEPSIDIEKSTNGADADDPPGPQIPVGDDVFWTYEITNTGNVPLRWSASDDQGVPLACPRLVFIFPGQTVICRGGAQAQAGQYENTGTATGTSPTGIEVTDDDPSHYFGAQPELEIEKSTNGLDADVGPGPQIAVGDDVTWTYVVTNPGNVPIAEVAVDDDQAGVSPAFVSGDDDSDGLLDPGETWTFEATGTATAGQYENTGTATGTDPQGLGLSADDPSHYFGVGSAIEIEKSTNGADADNPTGPLITVGDPVTWTYVVTNPGNAPIADVEVTDDQAGVDPAFTGGDDDSDGELDPSETWTFEADGIATEGQYENFGTVTGTDVLGAGLTDTDPSHYFGAASAIDIEKATNGADADDPPGPFIPVTDPSGDPTLITWTYVVTNTGNTTLTGLEVTDDHAGVTVSCPVDSLAPGRSTTCTATADAERGRYANLGTATATDELGTEVSDEDPSHYVGVVPGIDVEKATNGADADNAPGPFVPVGDPVTWTYVVTNTGDDPLTEVVVTDDQGVAVSCPQTTLAPDASMPCTAPAGTAEPGQYENLATATATGTGGRTVRDSDPSHYFGSEPSIDIEKSTNGADADDPPGPQIPVGDDVFWTYEITNTGNVPLRWSASDDQGVPLACPRLVFIFPGQTVICRGGAQAQAGQYENTGTATGTSPTGIEVTDDDPSHYFGAQPELEIEKSTNGLDADVGPGPQIAVGDDVTWTYVVTNPGNVPIAEVAVDDDQAGVSPAFVSGDDDSDGLLDPGETWTFEATGTATAGQYENTGTATGTDPQGLGLSADDPSHYFGVGSAIEIEKSTNGADADNPTGPLITVGDPVTWTYVVTNPGNAPLADVEVTDDQAGVDPAFTGGDDDSDGELDPSETWTFEADGIATEGQYENFGTVTGTDVLGAGLTDTDPSHYFGAASAIDIEKSTNGADADDPPGPFIPVGDDVTWTYVVTNPGNVPLAGVVVNDDVAGVDPTFTGGDDDSDDLLDPSETWTFEATGTATAGQYENTGTATGTSPTGIEVTDDDPSHYFGAQPELEIEKSTNGLDADVGPGPQIAVGDDVTWTYVVTNPGNVPIADVAVDDDQAGVSPAFVSGDDDSDGLLDPGETWTFEATGTATAGQYENTGTATGTDPQGLGLSADDPSHYFGVGSAIEIEKSTNGADADNPTGPLITVGDPVTWTYVVTNPGNAPIADVEVTDDQAGVDPAFTGGDDDSDGELDPSETWTFEADGIATEGQYENFGTVTGTDVLGAGLTDTDPSHYFGAASAIDIEKATNGADADDPPGPFIPVTDPSGDPTLITWTYVVTNTGNARLTGLEVTDDHAGVTVSCPVDSLAPGRSTTCTATADAERGRYANLGTATATDELGTEVSDEDPSHYVGVVPGIDVEKATNGADADNAPGPFVPVGDPVTWTYVVTNTGDDPLTEVVVTDDQGVAVSCPQTTLAPDASMPCTAPAGTAEPGQYENLATATATGTGGRTVRDSDPSHYFGSEPSIEIEKSTNGADADDPPGPQIPVGDDVFWTYEITNTGNVPLRWSASDDQGVPLACPRLVFIFPGQTVICRGGAQATAGQYENTGTAVGTSPTGVEVTDDDPSHYFGAQPELEIEKSTNGLDADVGPGPQIAVGDDVTWTYVVTNPGNVPIADVAVDDDQAGVSPAFVSGDDDSDGLLDPGETWTFEATGTATAGQYENTGTATGTDPQGLGLSADDPSHYFGVGSAIEIEKSTNGADADNPTGPLITVGDPVTWTYVVTNPGNAPLQDVVVSDDQGVTPVFQSGDADGDDLLDLDETWVYEATGTAEAGQYENTGEAAAADALGTEVTDSDPSHYFGAGSAIDIEKSTNGEDADSAPGPSIPVGAPVTWTYVVTNPGNVELSDVEVLDDQAGITPAFVGGDGDGDGLLDTVETWTFEATGTAEPGQYENTGTVTGSDPLEPGPERVLSDSDPSHYFGVASAIHIEKATNGIDADAAPGPSITVGDPVTWTYVVTNQGNSALTGVVVTDDRGVAVSCPGDALDPGEAMTCTGSGTAATGQYENVGTATGTDAAGAAVSDTDPSHYIGTFLAPPQADLEVEKKVIGPDVVPVGKKLRFKVVVRNNGPADAADVVLEDTIEGAVKVLSVDPSQGSCTGNKKIRCELGTILAGAKATITVVVRTLEEGKVNNAAAASSSTPDPDPKNNRDRDRGRAKEPRISIHKSVDKRNVEAGDELTYTIVVRSHSDTRLEDVRMCDDLPGGLILISAPGSDPDGNGDPCWTFDLPAHGKRKFTVHARVGEVSDGETLRNVAVAGASGVRRVADDARSEGHAPPPEVSPGSCRPTELPGPSFRC